MHTNVVGGCSVTITIINSIKNPWRGTKYSNCTCLWSTVRMLISFGEHLDQPSSQKKETEEKGPQFNKNVTTLRPQHLHYNTYNIIAQCHTVSATDCSYSNTVDVWNLFQRSQQQRGCASFACHTYRLPLNYYVVHSST